MNKVKRRRLAAARRAKKRRGIGFSTPSIEVARQEEALPEKEEISEKKSEHQGPDAGTSRRRSYTRKVKEEIKDEEES